MSPLQLGLLAIGALVIGSVMLYNWWQERTIRRDMVRRFDGSIDDVLMGKSVAINPDADDAFGMEQPPEPGREPFDEQQHAVVEHAEETPEAEWEEPEFTASEPDEGEFEPEPTIEEIDEPVEPEPVLLQAEEPLQEIEEEAVEVPLSEILTEQEPEDETDYPALTMPTVGYADDVPAATEPDLIERGLIEPSLIEPIMPLPSEVDAHIDEIATLTLDAPHSGAAVRDLLSATTNPGKPLRWFGASQGAWLPLTREHEQRDFSHIVAALQLADRSGAVQGNGYRTFKDQVDGLHQQLGGELAWNTQREVVEYAQALDQFCIEVDVTVTLHVAAGISGPFAGTKLRSLMEASGLVLNADGRFHATNDDGETLFTVCNSDQRPFTEDALRTALLHDLVLMLDVPRVKEASNTFKQMAMLGNRMEIALNAKLTDSRQRALGDAEIEQIRSQIKALHSKMQDRQLVPGSTPVLRLFS